jgi:glycosyltransferase involved in cell wall biosynthesis
MPYRILMLSDRYLPIKGGAELQAAALAKQLIARGHYIQLVTRRITPDLPSEEIIDGLPVRRLSPPGLSKGANALIVPRLVAYIRKHASDYDLLHVHGIGPVGLAAILGARLTRKPVLLKVTTPGEIRRDEAGAIVTAYTRFLRRYVLPPGLWRRILQQADALVTLTRETDQEAQANGLAKTTQRIPNGVDTNRFYPVNGGQRGHLRAQLDLSDEQFAFVFSGRLTHLKRVDVAIAAMQRLAAEYPPVRLLVAGSGEHQADSVEHDLRRQVTDSGLTQQVRFLGQVDDMPSLLQAADAYVFPSMREGLPNALLEAIACGLPVVASDIGGVRDVIPDKRYGALCPVGDVDAFAAGMLACMTQRIDAQKRAQAAMERVQADFSLDAVVSRYEALYAHITGAAGR